MKGLETRDIKSDQDNVFTNARFVTGTRCENISCAGTYSD